MDYELSTQTEEDGPVFAATKTLPLPPGPGNFQLLYSAIQIAFKRNLVDILTDFYQRYGAVIRVEFRLPKLINQLLTRLTNIDPRMYIIMADPEANRLLLTANA